MPCEEGADKYKFCISSNYYNVLLKYAEANKSNVDKEKICDKISTSMGFSNNIDVREICKEFKALYKSFSIYSGKTTLANDIFSNYDCTFLNYWLNDKLRENVSDNSNYVKKFYEKIKEQDGNFFSNDKNLEKYLHVIDPNILENMKLLYELYDNAVKVINIIKDPTYKYEENKSCSDYIKECDEKYKEAMDNCLNSNADYYNALKLFKYSYKFLTSSSTNTSNICEYSKFCFFPEYDPVLEKQRNTIKVSSTLFVLSLVLPLIYKYTPCGPFLRKKINMVKDKWMNPDKNGDELLPLSTDIEENISDNENYNIAYYSETN
ncbi:PIR protein [Plasmodium ovale]|uniref:PIR protein n=1 Tax=Plasmodium ovale TaxID=36330 RepID=A0A1C3KJD5_PLAOA|nr:PIR protein [Plasmodium ovale]